MRMFVMLTLACVCSVAWGQGGDATRGAVLETHDIPHGTLPRQRQIHSATITEAADGTLVASTAQESLMRDTRLAAD